MKRFIAVFVVAYSVLALAAGGEKPSGHLAALQEKVQSHSKFAKALYLQLVKENKGNIFFSPQSIHVILSLAAMGAGGTTLSQMASALAFGGSREEVQTAYKELLPACNSKSNGSLQSGNLIAVDKKFTVKKEFLAAGQNFLAKVENLDFNSQAEAANSVNKFVADITKNKIKEILNKDAFSSEAPVILVNAVYFAGRWENPFYNGSTKEEKFYVTKTIAKTVQMMHVESVFSFANKKEISATLVELPYKDSNLTLVIILPFDVDGLSKVENYLENHSLESVLNSQLDKDNCHICLPKFKIEKEMQLKDTLSKIGLGNMFSTSADFSGISSVPLHVKRVVHKAVVDVDEQGTVAAAATPVQMELKSGPRLIRADHPFLFVIRDKVTGAVLFMGRYSDPA